MQNQSSFFIPFADGRLHHRKSSPVVQFSIGALVVEVSTEQWFWWYFATRSSIGASPKQLPQPSSTPKYRSHSGLCMTEKLPTGVLIDGVVIPCSNDQNSLSSISQYHQCRDFGLPQPESTTKYRSHSGLCMPKRLPMGVVMDGIAIPWSDDQNSLSSIPQYHECRDLGLPQPGSTTKHRSQLRLSMTKKLSTGVLIDGIAIPWSNDANSLSSIRYSAKKAI